MYPNSSITPWKNVDFSPRNSVINNTIYPKVQNRDERDNGFSYDGPWIEGQRHGEGTLENGKEKYFCKYINGKLVRMDRKSNYTSFEPFKPEDQYKNGNRGSIRLVNKPKKKQRPSKTRKMLSPRLRTASPYPRDGESWGDYKARIIAYARKGGLGSFEENFDLSHDRKLTGVTWTGRVREDGKTTGRGYALYKNGDESVSLVTGNKYPNGNGMRIIKGKLRVIRKNRRGKNPQDRQTGRKRNLKREDTHPSKRRKLA